VRHAPHSHRDAVQCHGRRDGDAGPDGDARSDRRRHADADSSDHIGRADVADSDAHACADTHADPSSDTDPDAGAHADADARTHADADARTHSDTDPGSDAYADPDACSHADAGADRHADPDAGADAYADPDACSHAGSDADTRTDHGNVHRQRLEDRHPDAELHDHGARGGGDHREREWRQREREQ
jgi:hypothetical protein